MRALALSILAVSCLVASLSLAAPVKMTGKEIEAALAGNSVQGVWGSTPYTSYFDPGGSTVYTAEGRAPDTGSWRVKGNQYCSVWHQGGEFCYDLERDGDTIVWVVPETGKRYLSTLVKGRI